MNAQRYARICEMLAVRQPDLTVCMEQVHKPHNVSAIVRTVDAVGVHEVHAVWPGARMRTMASTAAGSNSWVSVKTHQTIGEAVSHLKGRGMQICHQPVRQSGRFPRDRLHPPDLYFDGSGENRDHSGSAGSGGSGHHHPHDRHGAVPECLCGLRAHSV